MTKRIVMGLVLVCAAVLSVGARTVEIAALPVPEFLDTEVSTNVTLRMGDAFGGRILQFSLSLESTPSNALQIAFGDDANGDGSLSFEETASVLGWRSGRCFVEDVRGGCRIEECVPAVGAQVRRLDVRIVTDGDNGIREAVFTCEGQPIFRELDDLSFLFGREWNLLRVTRRRVGAPDDWVTCSVRDRSLVLRIR